MVIKENESNSRHGEGGMVPLLRFPEFRNAPTWEEKPLGDVADVKGGKRIPKGYSFSTTKTDFPYIRVSDVFMGGIDVFSVRFITQEIESQIKHYKISKDDLFITVAGTIGLVGMVPKELDNANLTENANKIVLSKNLRKDFLYFTLASDKHQSLLLSNITNNAQPKLSLERIRNLEIPIPHPDEQRKIADCLTSLDEVITAQTQAVDALKTHKTGLMQQLFPAEGETVPRLRFADFKNAPPWEEKRLGDEDVAEFFKGKGISKSDIQKNGITPCIRYGELYTIYNEIIDNVYSHTNVSSSELFFSKKNDVIIPSSGETKIDIAKASCVTLDDIALGADLNVIRSKHNGVFLSYYFNGALKKNIAKVAQGDAVAHLYSSQLKKLTLTIPHPDEQLKIADCLTSLDEVINAQTAKLEALKAHKQALMQQLFPRQEGVSK